jgi:hypothetical protein
VEMTKPTIRQGISDKRMDTTMRPGLLSGEVAFAKGENNRAIFAARYGYAWEQAGA